MSRLLSLTLILTFTALLLACADSSKQPSQTPASTIEPESALDPVVQQAVEIARAIEAQPDRAEQILEESDMTLDQFEQLMVKIAEDPDLSEQYEAAMQSS